MKWATVKFASGFCMALLMTCGAVTTVCADSPSPAESHFPAASELVARALDEFQAARDKASVGGSIRGDDARLIHGAFFAKVDMNKVTVWDAAAIIDKPVFTMHQDDAQTLRQHLITIATNESTAEGALAAAICLQLPRAAGAPRNENEILARALLDCPELASLLHSDYAGTTLGGIAKVPKNVAQERARQMLGFARQLDPLTSSSAVFEAENYRRAVLPLAIAAGETNRLQTQIVSFISSGAEKHQYAKKYFGASRDIGLHAPVPDERRGAR